MNKLAIIIVLVIFVTACSTKIVNSRQNESITAKMILGNPNYQAICYGGYRENTREIEPTVSQIKEDLKILSAMNIKLLRTYNVHHKEVKNLLLAIRELQRENAFFEMYVMLGAWIDCKNAWTALQPIHNQESDRNVIEIGEAVRLANEYPEIIKIITVGNEAMVKWATAYYVEPGIILKWVKYLQELKIEKKLPKNLWVTSSDNFASWGGGDKTYHVGDLNQLIKAVDFISLHTYPMHDTHYNPSFWGLRDREKQMSDANKIDAAMIRARDYAIDQYKGVLNYMRSLGVEKPIAVGETGWATQCNEQYGNNGSNATDEYKSALYYKLMREWSDKERLSLFYFEAFDEHWKDSRNPMGSENHFGLINQNGQAKFALWNLVDQGVFKHLTRDGHPITKTYQGDLNALWKEVKMPSRLILN